MKRVLLICPSPDDATSFYRGWGPWSRLQRDSSGVQIISVNQLTWSSVCTSDVVFLQRPFATQHVQAVELCKKNRVPVWVDYDDDLFSVPSDNPTFGVYGSEATRKNIAKILAMADAVTVSTEFLKGKFAKLNKNIHVVPNAIDDWRFEYRTASKVNRQKMVLWRGSNTHQRDLMTVSQEIVDVALKNPTWMFNFVGYNPFWITEPIGKSAMVSPSIDVVDYMRFIYELAPKVMIVPLVKCDFNLAKSNIAWIEGTFAGAAVIAPDIPEFRQPGVFAYKDQNHFKELLSSSLAGRLDLSGANQESWDHIKKVFVLSATNKLRAKILDDLCSKERGFGVEQTIHPIKPEDALNTLL